MTDLERAAQINATIRAQSIMSAQVDMTADALKREREHEREECAKVVDDLVRGRNEQRKQALREAAKAIRSRKS